MGKIEIDWKEIFGGDSSPDRQNGNYLGYPSSAPHAAAIRAGLAGARRARASAKFVARASSDDEQPRGTQALNPRLEALCSKLERLVGELERSAGTRGGCEENYCLLGLQEAADRGQDAHSAAENVRNFNQEDEQGEHVARQNSPKPSPVLARRKKNHEQADGDRKRVARPAAENDNKEPAPPEEIFEALREIPSLDQDDLLRAYSTLIRDDRLFRSLMALPKDMRKNWLLMEIGNH